MHELPVTRGILSVALEASENAGGHPIQAIDLVIGALSSIVDDSVQFYFDILSQGTLAEHATLRFRREPAQMTCFVCGAVLAVEPPLPDVCPACERSSSLLVSEGREFYVEAIEINESNESNEQAEVEEDADHEGIGSQINSDRQ
jgi:hydrogenase nickel incorporation protein HypA/HybF